MPKMMSKLLAVVALATLVVAASALLDHEPILNDAMIAEINAKNGGLWTAGRNPRFEGVSVAEIKRMCGTKLTYGKHGLPMMDAEIGALPDGFDWRTQTPNCIGAVRDQGHCGSCWAYGTAEALSDRFCVQSKGAKSIQLSTQIMVSCSDAGSCDGGYPSAGMLFLSLLFLPTL
jgi:cathepsin B